MGHVFTICRYTKFQNIGLVLLQSRTKLQSTLLGGMGDGGWDKPGSTPLQSLIQFEVGLGGLNKFSEGMWSTFGPLHTSWHNEWNGLSRYFTHP